MVFFRAGVYIIERKKEMQTKKETRDLRHRILTIVGIVLCVILIPLLIVNCTLLIKGAVNREEVPTFGSYLPLIILSDSMHDEFPTGSLILCKTAEPGEIQKDDIISFYDPQSSQGSVVTHKVLTVNKNPDGSVESFTTYGTANNGALDPVDIPAENLIGRYTGFRIKGAGSVAMFMQTTPGFIICVFVPLLLLVSYDLIRRKLFDRKNEDDKDELLRELEELRRLKASQSGELKVESGDENTDNPISSDE